jgi:heme A synthase
MKTGLVLLRLTGAALGLQLLLGGFLTFGFISAGAHIVMGFILFILAIATMAAWLVSKPALRPMQVLAVVIVVLLLLQIILGFATLNNGSQAIAFVHFVNALAIFGATISGTFITMRFDRVSSEATTHDVGTIREE